MVGRKDVEEVGKRGENSFNYQRERRVFNRLVALYCNDHMIWKTVVFAVLTAIATDQATLSQTIRFEDQSSNANVGTAPGSTGIAVADYNNDGWDDLFIAAADGNSVLLENQHDGTFSDKTQEAGLIIPGNANAPLWGDLNNDGYIDLFVGSNDRAGEGRIFQGSASGQFVDVSELAGIDLSAIVGSASLGDYDNDGLLDLFIATREAEDRLYRNRSNSNVLSFEDISDRARIGGDSITIAMQATWVDIDRDQDLDLFAVHDGNVQSRLYENHAFLPLIDTSYSSDLKVARSAMGVSWGDYNNDGWPDVYITNIDQGNLFKNLGNGDFVDVTTETGTRLNGMSWGVVFADFDNDGDEDIFIGNTFDFDGRYSFLYENQNGQFVNIARDAGAALGTNTFGVATGDFNNDGLVDLIVADFGGDNRLLVNRSESPGNWVQLQLQGSSVNAMSVGATVEAVVGEKRFYRTISAGSSFCSQVSPRVHFGLGEATRIDTLRVTWGKERVQELVGIEANQLYNLVQNQSISVHREKVMLLEQHGTLSDIYPNPIITTAKAVYTLSQPRNVSLEVYDVLGRRVDTLYEGARGAGRFEYTLHREAYSAGVYLMRFWLDSGEVHTRTFVVTH